MRIYRVTWVEDGARRYHQFMSLDQAREFISILQAELHSTRLTTANNIVIECDDDHMPPPPSPMSEPSERRSAWDRLEDEVF